MTPVWNSTQMRGKGLCPLLVVSPTVYVDMPQGPKLTVLPTRSAFSMPSGTQRMSTISSAFSRMLCTLSFAAMRIIFTLLQASACSSSVL